MEELDDEEENSGVSMAISAISSYQVGLPMQDLHKISPPQIHPGWGSCTSGLSFSKGLLAVNTRWRKIYSFLVPSECETTGRFLMSHWGDSLMSMLVLAELIGLCRL